MKELFLPLCILLLAGLYRFNHVPGSLKLLMMPSASIAETHLNAWIQTKLAEGPVL